MSGKCNNCSEHVLECRCSSKGLTLRDKIVCFIEYFPTITKDQADFMEDLLKWDDEKKMAFMMAKRIFEEKED